MSDKKIRTFGWSYAQLPAEQAHLFRRLGLHPGAEFGVHAAAVLAELDLATANRRLDALADAHLIERVGDKRYRLHDLLHTYAAHRADVDDTADGRHRARTAVLTWYAHTARTADRPLFPGLPYLEVELNPVVHNIVLDDREQALEWLNREQANLMAALRTAVQHHLYDIALVLATTARFLILHNRTLWTVRAEAETLGLTAAQASHNRAAEAFLRGFRGETLTELEKLSEAEADFTAQLALARELHDPIHERFALGGLGRVRMQQKRYPEAVQYYQKALPLARRAADRRPEAVVECNLSQINAHLGRYEQALHHAERELALRRHAGDHVGKAYALWNQAVARQGLGEHDTAIELTDQAMEMYRTLAGTENLRAPVLETAAISLEHIGDVTLAAERLTEARVLLQEIDAPRADALRDRAHTLMSRAADPNSE